MMVDLSINEDGLAKPELSVIFRVGELLGFDSAQILAFVEDATRDFFTNARSRAIDNSLDALKLPRRNTAILTSLICTITADKLVTDQERDLIHHFGKLMGFEPTEIETLLQDEIQSFQSKNAGLN